MNNLIPEQIKKDIQVWVTGHYFQIAVFNLIIILMFLLYSAGYFDPYLRITINIIVLIGLIVSIPLLNAGSRAILTVAILFWLFAAFLRVVKIEVWAERTVIYAYEALLLGVILLIKENISFSQKRKT
ncbi:MAG: hypothetical protein AAB546_03295 [Patescibacteria group bacterium]